jgi:hypothetical protein
MPILQGACRYNGAPAICQKEVWASSFTFYNCGGASRGKKSLNIFCGGAIDFF